MDLNLVRVVVEGWMLDSGALAQLAVGQRRKFLLEYRPVGEKDVKVDDLELLRNLQPKSIESLNATYVVIDLGIRVVADARLAEKSGWGDLPVLPPGRLVVERWGDLRSDWRSADSAAATCWWQVIAVEERVHNVRGRTYAQLSGATPLDGLSRRAFVVTLRQPLG